MIEYPQIRHLSPEYVRQKVAEFIAEDAPDGDRTTMATVNADTIARAFVVGQEPLCFAGTDFLPHAFPASCSVHLLAKDGDQFTTGTNLAEISGPAVDMLTYERPMLNILQRLCAIATNVQSYVKNAPKDLWILDTRKTTPGLRLLEKYAVAAGGGRNHRTNLSNGILIKDNHIVSAGSVENAVRNCRAFNPGLPIELEVDTIEQIREALPIGVDGFLLDNMNRDRTIEAVQTIREWQGGDDIFIESSGGIRAENISDYYGTGINAVSIGALTHAVKNLDIKLEFSND